LALTRHPLQRRVLVNRGVAFFYELYSDAHGNRLDLQRIAPVGKAAKVHGHRLQTALWRLSLSVSSPLYDKCGQPSAALSDQVEVVLLFGALMLRAGNTAIRTRELMEAIAQKMGFEAVSVSLSLDNVTASVRRSGECATAMREIGRPRINALQIAALEQLAITLRPGVAPHEIEIKLVEIESGPHCYAPAQIIVAIAVASGGFAFLNGGAAPEVILAGIGGGVGQWCRQWLARSQLDHYGVAALSAVAASGVYVLAAWLIGQIGFGFRRRLRAKAGPNFRTQRRTVSYEVSTPRSARSSSTSR
jgi:uncharacterized membrane protein YjjP (DUF1212 family)